MDEAMLHARKEALDELMDIFTRDQYDVAEKAIDKYMDALEALL